MNKAHPYNAAFHNPRSEAAKGYCSQHGKDSVERGTCAGTPVISFKDKHNRRQSGCTLVLKQLTERGELEASQ